MTYGSVWGMMRRIPALSQVTSAQVNDFLLGQASIALDTLLGQAFPVPFSANNVTVNGMLIYDLAELRARDMDRDAKTGDALRTHVSSMLGALALGKAVMLQASSITAATGSADTVFYAPYTKLIAAPDIVPPWMQVSALTGNSYVPVFDMDDWVNQQVDPNLVDFQRTLRQLSAGSGP